MKQCNLLMKKHSWKAQFWVKGRESPLCTEKKTVCEKKWWFRCLQVAT